MRGPSSASGQRVDRMAHVIRKSVGLDLRKLPTAEQESLPSISDERAAELREIYRLYDEELTG